MNDPFSLTYDLLWRLVERNNKLREYLSIGNRIKYDEHSSVKREVADSDLPELALLSGGASETERNSSHRYITKNYTWVIATGDNRINVVYNRIAFELYRSMVDFECEACKLEWCDCRFIENINITSVDEGTSFNDLERGISGWAALWNIEVRMVFSFQSLKLKTDFGSTPEPES